MKKYTQNRKTIEVNCDNCGKLTIKPLSEHKRNISKDRKMFCSRSCSCKYGNRSFDQRDQTNRYDIRLSAHNPADELTNFRYAFRSSKKRHHQHTITLEDIRDLWDNQKGICPYTGYTMQLRKYSNNNITDKMKQASLDRIDSNFGYIKGNIQWVCCAINYLKNVFTHEQTINFLKNINYSDFSEDRTISSLDVQVLDALGSP